MFTVNVEKKNVARRLSGTLPWLRSWVRGRKPRKNRDGIICMYAWFISYCVRHWRTHFIFVTFSRFLMGCLPRVSPWIQIAFKVLLTGWLASPLDFMWLIGRQRNHRHPVIPLARSSFVVDRNIPRFANLDECDHCSKFLQPLWLILTMKKSLSSVMGADLK